MSDALDTFGRFLMENLRDKALGTADLTLKGHWKAPSLLKLQAELAALSDEQRELVRRLVRHVVDSATHDFLFALNVSNDFEKDVQIISRGQNVAAISDGIHGESFGENGWQARFSKFGQAPDEA